MSENFHIKGFDNAVLITMATAFAYAVAWRYETGYLTFFGIPSTFVTVEIDTLATAIGLLVGTFFIAYAVVEFAAQIFRGYVSAKLPLFTRLGLMWAIILTIARVGFGFSILFVVQLTCALLLAIAPFSAPAFVRRKRIRRRRAVRPYSFYVRAHDRQQRRITFPFNLALHVAFFAALATAGAESAGHKAAHVAEKRTILHLDGKTCIVVEHYADSFLCSNFTKSGVLESFQLIPIKDSPLYFTVDYVTPLQHAESVEFEQ